MDIVIDKNIPAPKSRKKHNWKERLNKLEVGESFRFPKECRNSIANRVSTDFHASTKKVFTISGNRVWRTA